MKLADWMHTHHLTPGQLRRMLGVKSRSTVTRWITGERTPSARLLNEIRDLSGGAVTRDDFFDPRPPGCLRLIADRAGRVREVYPWTEIELHFPQTGGGPREAAWAGDAEDVWPSPPLQKALDTLHGRARVTGAMEFLFDGRRIDARRLVAEANRVREKHNLPPIAYPGVLRP